MFESKKWYAVYTRPRCEKKIVTILTRNGIENYCPLNRVSRHGSERKKFITEPLFTSYVFVKISPLDHARLKKIEGVVNLIHWLGNPAVIRDMEIEMIKNFVAEHTNITLQKCSINAVEKVRALSNPIFEQDGQMLFVKNRTINMALPSIGYTMYANVESGNVVLVGESSTKEHLFPGRLQAAK